MVVKLLTEHHLEFLSLQGSCTGSSETTPVKLLEISCRGSITKLIHEYIHDLGRGCEKLGSPILSTPK